MNPINGVKISLEPTVTSMSADSLFLIDTWPITPSSTSIITKQNALLDMGSQVFNDKAYGSVGNGVADDTAAINTTIAEANTAGHGIVFLSPGIHLVSGPLTAPAEGVTFFGGGAATVFLLSGGYTGGPLFTLSNSNSQLYNIKIIGGPNQTSETSINNPAFNMIEVTGSASVVSNIEASYCNGYIVEVKGTATTTPDGTFVEKITGFGNVYGVHTLGNTGTGYGTQTQLQNINLQEVTTGDVVLIEDSWDVQLSTINSSIKGNSSSNSSNIRIHGNCSTVICQNVDLGVYPTAPGNTSAMVIETGTNGTPTTIKVLGGIVQGGADGIDVNGNDVYLQNIRFQGNGNNGVKLNGGTDITIDGCQFYTNGRTAGTGRNDIYIGITNPVSIVNCYFGTAIGSSGNQVNNVITMPNSANKTTIANCNFAGTSSSISNILNNSPLSIRNCVTFNPYGTVSVSVPLTTVATAALPYDTYYFITANASGGVSLVVSNGPTLTVPAGTTATVLVPAGQTLTPTYTDAPTWVVYGN